MVINRGLFIRGQHSPLATWCPGGLRASLRRLRHKGGRELRHVLHGAKLAQDLAGKRMERSISRDKVATWEVFSSTPQHPSRVSNPHRIRSRASVKCLRLARGVAEVAVCCQLSGSLDLSFGHRPESHLQKTQMFQPPNEGTQTSEPGHAMAPNVGLAVLHN